VRGEAGGCDERCGGDPDAVCGSSVLSNEVFDSVSGYIIIDKALCGKIITGGPGGRARCMLRNVVLTMLNSC
jgi:hypothetical protein